jgi:hypothetical protein
VNSLETSVALCRSCLRLRSFESHDCAAQQCTQSHGNCDLPWVRRKDKNESPALDQLGSGKRLERYPVQKRTRFFAERTPTPELVDCARPLALLGSGRRGRVAVKAPPRDARIRKRKRRGCSVFPQFAICGQTVQHLPFACSPPGLRHPCQARSTASHGYRLPRVFARGKAGARPVQGQSKAGHHRHRTGIGLALHRPCRGSTRSDPSPANVSGQTPGSRRNVAHFVHKKWTTFETFEASPHSRGRQAKLR